jgi:hypothetical protein
VTSGAVVEAGEVARATSRILPGGSADRPCREAFFILAFQVPDRETRFEREESRLGCVVGNPESAGLNRHVVGDGKALQERK